LQPRLEAVIILGELHSDVAEGVLIQLIADKNQDPEIRGGAAWALGELRRPTSMDALVEAFTAIEEPIRIEAVRALRKIVSATGADVLAKLPAASEDQRAGIAWVASRARMNAADKLLRVMVDDDARRWVAYILGTQDEESVIEQMELLRARDAEVYFAVTVLWKIFASWINDVEEH
jgi:HEAT repeat protein